MSCDQDSGKAPARAVKLDSTDTVCRISGAGLAIAAADSADGVGKIPVQGDSLDGVGQMALASNVPDGVWNIYKPRKKARV